MKASRPLALLVLLLFLWLTQFQPASAQAPEDVIKTALRAQNTTAGADFISERAFNILMRRRVSNYLTGSADLSLFQSYATYSAESDKLNFGFNIPYPNPRQERVRFLFAPMIETGMKKNFATLYKKGKWENGIRAGLKATYIFPGSIHYYNNTGAITIDTQKGRMIAKRMKILNELLDKVERDLMDVRRKQTTVQDELNNANLTLPTNSITVANVAPFDLQKKTEEYLEEFAKLEADLLEEHGAYSYSSSYWVSLTGFIPLVGDSLYTSTGPSELFSKKRSKPWEFSLQGNALWEGVSGSVFLNGTVKIFNNNSALASLMTKVDYNRYSQFPGTNPLNYAQLETDVAYIGDYQQFTTTSLSAQGVYMAPLKGFFNGGVSIRYEKNVGDYSPVNIKLGFPLRFKGKEKPVNIEPQILWNDVANYKNAEDHEVTRTVGINVGLPFTALF